jgi:hypothetical protein|tara:strand:- start:1746 stop:2141 length:396 start_codon:yes stop_codon:yes gene_type:complete
MNYTKNMWDIWKGFRLEEESDDLTKLFEEFQKAGVDEFTAYGSTYSNPEAKVFVKKDVQQMGKILNKASQQSIKVMLSGVKAGKYDAMDLIRGIKEGPAGDTSMGVRDMLQVLWNKVEKRFRKYLGGKKRR